MKDTNKNVWNVRHDWINNRYIATIKYSRPQMSQTGQIFYVDYSREGNPMVRIQKWIANMKRIYSVQYTIDEITF